MRHDNLRQKRQKLLSDGSNFQVSPLLFGAKFVPALQYIRQVVLTLWYIKPASGTKWGPELAKALYDEDLALTHEGRRPYIGKLNNVCQLHIDFNNWHAEHEDGIEIPDEWYAYQDVEPSAVELCVIPMLELFSGVTFRSYRLTKPYEHRDIRYRLWRNGKWEYRTVMEDRWIWVNPRWDYRRDLETIE